MQNSEKQDEGAGLVPSSSLRGWVQEEEEGERSRKGRGWWGGEERRSSRKRRVLVGEQEDGEG